MNLYRISQNSNTGYGTYDSAVVVAENEEQARKINLDACREWNECGYPIFVYSDGRRERDDYTSWAKTLEDVKVEMIGTAVDDLQPGTIVCASFNAG